MKPIRIKRILLYLLGLMIMTFGIALSSKAGLGVAPISTIAHAGSRIFPLSFGLCSSLFHGFCFVVQLVIKRKLSFMAMLQIPAVYVFGFLIDLFNGLLRFSVPSFVPGVLLMVLSAVFIALGLRIIIGADFVLAPPDSLARVIGESIGWSMSKSKLAFDIAVVSFSAAFTFLLLGSPLISVGIGTVICMLIVGPAIGFFQKSLPFFTVTDN